MHTSRSLELIYESIIRGITKIYDGVKYFKGPNDIDRYVYEYAESVPGYTDEQVSHAAGIALIDLLISATPDDDIVSELESYKNKITDISEVYSFEVDDWFLRGIDVYKGGKVGSEDRGLVQKVSLVKDQLKILGNRTISN